MTEIRRRLAAGDGGRIGPPLREGRTQLRKRLSGYLAVLRIAAATFLSTSASGVAHLGCSKIHCSESPRRQLTIHVPTRRAICPFSATMSFHEGVPECLGRGLAVRGGSDGRRHGVAGDCVFYCASRNVRDRALWRILELSVGDVLVAGAGFTVWPRAFTQLRYPKTSTARDNHGCP
jgi:hypothetical protein